MRNFNVIEINIPKEKQIVGKKKSRKNKEIVLEKEHVLVYGGFGILNYYDGYTVTIIAECPGKGKKIATCKKIVEAYMLIKMLNTFYPSFNKAVKDGKNIDDLAKVLYRAKMATRELVGDTCGRRII